MLLQKNFTEEHIRELQKNSHRDPVLLERTIYAFGLLEALRKVGMPFIFKGGTCLMLLMEHPRRLSTDIDVVVEPGTDIEKCLECASKIFPFEKVEEQKRFGKNNIEKRHFKFSYYSPISNKPFYILLDVLFERNNYSELIQKEIRNDLLLTEPQYLTVSMPSANCILADKLTAFAPHTTGIPLNAGKDMEVMKQFYDVSSLLDIVTDFQQIVSTYEKIAQAEIAYRGVEISSGDCLWDTFNAALCIAARGKVKSDEYPIYVKGTRELRGHIYTENFTAETASIKTTKIMYMALCLLSKTEYVRASDWTEFLNMEIQQKDLLPLHYLKKIDREAYAYLIKTDKLLNELRYQ